MPRFISQVFDLAQVPGKGMGSSHFSHIETGVKNRHLRLLKHFRAVRIPIIKFSCNTYMEDLMKKLSSHQIRQILACVTQNRSCRELVDQLGVSKASISRIFNASVRGDKSPQELLKLTDNELEEFFYPTLGSKFVEPDWPPIHILLQRRGVT